MSPQGAGCPAVLHQDTFSELAESNRNSTTGSLVNVEFTPTIPKPINHHHFRYGGCPTAFHLSLMDPRSGIQGESRQHPLEKLQPAIIQLKLILRQGYPLGPQAMSGAKFD